VSTKRGIGEDMETDTISLKPIDLYYQLGCCFRPLHGGAFCATRKRIYRLGCFTEESVGLTTRSGRRRVAFLSPWPSSPGRGNRIPRFVLRNVCAANPALGSSQNRRMVHPLPEGEGRGEGEQSVVYPTHLSVMSRMAE